MSLSFFFHGNLWAVWGIRRGITGLISSQGSRLTPLKFPPPQMKVAVEVEDGMQVFQLLNSCKLFGFAFQQLQLSGGRFSSLWAFTLHLLLFSRVQLCGLTKLHFFANKLILRSFCQFSREWKNIWEHLRVVAAHPVPFFEIVSISTIYCLIINTQQSSKHEMIHAYSALYDRNMNFM